MESSDEVDHSPLPDQVRLMNMHIGNVVHVNPDIRGYFNEARTDESVENEEWLLKPELPSSAEILGTDLPEDEEDCVQLMPNHIEGPWPSRNSYLRAHYELLREDSIAPLRDAVAYVRDEPKMMDSKEVSIYDMVCFLPLHMATPIWYLTKWHSRFISPVLLLRKEVWHFESNSQPIVLEETLFGSIPSA